VRALALLGAVLVLAGCGVGGGGHGTATLWVTRDQGTDVVYAGTVPAGLDAIQVVERRLKLTTRYGGRYVQSIDGISGSLSSQRDWFFYVDGIEGDRSAAEVTVHPGDVVWWDYRHWTPATMDVPAVVGAYPHPFSDSDTRVVGPVALARPIARQVHGTVGGVGSARNMIVVSDSLAPDTARISHYHHGYRLDLGVGIARRLAQHPTALRFRFAS
jgi:hypothetical protein